MSHFAQALLAATAAALILATGASSRPMESASDSPALIAPAPGYSVTGGTPIVFQVRTFPGDALVLHVSRSPSRSSCGVIGNDVAGKIFSSTSDAAVYQAAPTYSVGGWMDTPGTYYWQAYRNVYDNGSDGCIESEVRSLTIKPGPRLTPPALVAPAPGQNIVVGAGVSFRIRTHSGDRSLRLRVSRSQTADSCGKIGADVASESFGATSDPLVFEATPLHTVGDWMDTPGTYYWQAYRAEYGAGADGCVESEIRSFTIKNPPPRKLAAARLEGAFKIKLTIRTIRGIRNIKRGRTYIEGWTFTPRCANGSCRTTARASARYSTLGSWTLVLRRSGARYKKGRPTMLLRCLSTAVSGPLNIKLRVTKAAWVDKEWRATHIRGNLRHSVRATASHGYHCKAATIKATLRGSLLE